MMTRMKATSVISERTAGLQLGGTCRPRLLIAGMTSWYLGNTAREFEHLDSLAGYWVSNSARSGVSTKRYKRIWDYHIAQTPFYRMPFAHLEENMRWHNLRFYDFWMARQTIPGDTNVVQGPMGSCEALFALVNRCDRRILKVFDAPNSHPRTLHSFWQRECDEFSPGYRVPMAAWVRRRIERELDQADVVLCPSTFVKETMIGNGVPESKCFVSHFGVDTSTFTPRTELPNPPLFVCVAILSLRKGHQYLFRAMEIVRREIPDARLVCVGLPRPDCEIERQRWAGTFEHHIRMKPAEVASLLGSATAMVLPSVEEGFARVLSEAMACGIPLIATHETGIGTVARNGVEALIVPARDSRKLAEAMIELGLDAEKNRLMGEAGRAAGGNSNTWADYARRLYAEYGRRLSEL